MALPGREGLAVNGGDPMGFGIASAISTDVIQPSSTAAESLDSATFRVNDTTSGDGLTALVVGLAAVSLLGPRERLGDVE